MPHRFLALVAALCVLTPASGISQTILVRLLDANNGKPIAKRFVSVVFLGKEHLPEVTRLTDDSGAAVFPIPAGADEFSLMGGGTEKEPYRTAYANCGESTTSTFMVAAVVQGGIVPKNKCGRATVSPKSGEIVYWGLPPAWWQPDFQ